ncbi:MAG: ribbon-helix-helix protein, CopG family [archaeon]|nr:ribbon-helix-helix protein, CopG family [archaeon]
MPMVSLQVSDDILNKFDTIQRESGYMSRSEALRDAILNFVKEIEERKEQKGIKWAIISITYSSGIDNLETISQIDHRFESEIKTYSEYAHKSKNIRVYITNGESDRLNDFLEAFNALKDTQPNIMFI